MTEGIPNSRASFHSMSPDFIRKPIHTSAVIPTIIREYALAMSGLIEKRYTREGMVIIAPPHPVSPITIPIRSIDRFASIMIISGKVD